MVDWGRAQGRRIHGTTLIWCTDEYLPQWLLSRAWTRAELRAVMEDHITRVMGHFRGRVPAWDVVNEAFASDGSPRDCLWQRVIGSDWIELALRAAHAADPGARLFYNETRADVPNSKFAAVEAMAQDFRAREVPLDGIGLQYHLVQGDGPLQFLAEDAMRRIEALGLAVHVSELDAVTSPFPGTREEKLDRQAQAFQTVASACQAVDACFRVTLWGAADHWSWRGRAEMAVALDDQFREKPGWAGIQEAIRTPAPSSQRPPSAPGRPTASAAVNAGVFTVSWAPAADPEGDRVSYALEHRDADDPGWRAVATGVRGTSFSFVGGRLERQGTYAYRVRASDGRAAGSWSPVSADVVVDRTDPATPTLTPDRPLAFTGGGGWYRDGVALAFAGSGDPPLLDGSPGSGVDPASVPAAQTFATTGAHTARGVVRDRAGNASRAAGATVQVDATPPAVSLECPGPVRAGETAGASWIASDAGSGLGIPAAGSVVLDTARPGTFTASYEAADRVGHRSTARCEYIVEAASEPTPPPAATPTPAPSPAATPTPTPTPTPAAPAAISTPTPSPTATPTPVAPAATSSPSPAHAATPPGAGLTVSAAPRVRVRGPRRVGLDGKVRLAVTCSAACAGRLWLHANPRSRSAAVRRLRTLGSRSFRAAAGRTTVVIRLARRERRVLARLGRMPVRARVRLDEAADRTTRRLTLRSGIR